MTHYIPSNEKNEKEILNILGISTFEDLISIIPSNLRVKNGILGLESGISEYENTTASPTLSAYLEEVSLFTDIDSWNDNDDKITMMTIH